MSAKKIPRDHFIMSIIKEVLRKRRIIQSQEDLCFFVLSELKKYDKKFVLSPKRVKSLAIKIPGIEIKAKTKKSPKMKKLEKCPICKKKVDKIHGKNLLNKKIHIGYLCKRCSYTTDLDSLVPMKYLFLWKGKNKTIFSK
jgi:hypothetical protein